MGVWAEGDECCCICGAECFETVSSCGNANSDGVGGCGSVVGGDEWSGCVRGMVE